MTRKWLLPIGVHVGSLIPLARLIIDYFTDNLTVNPIQNLTQRTGITALILLVLCLACTPLNRWLGWKLAVSLRKPLGLYAFLYASLHLLIFAVLDYGLSWALISDTIVEKRYVLVGLAAFLLLLPLAITSTKGWQRRLGKGWRSLHRLIYPAAILVILHYLWLSKVPRAPLIFGAIVLALLVLRLPALRRLRPASHVQPNVQRPRRVGQGADRDVVNPALGHGANGVEGDAAARLE
jgi:methionine sulfoxide reductase heme-binding subunit